MSDIPAVVKVNGAGYIREDLFNARINEGRDSMKIDIEAFRKAGEAGKLGKTWDNCLMGALAGHSKEACVQNGWPKWLVEIGVWVNDTATDDRRFADGLRFAEASVAFNARGGDADRLFRDLRLQAILPIAMDAIGDGDEPWRADCRAVVQWSMDNDGQAAWAAWAAGAARAAEAEWAAGAAWAASSASAARAAARDRILDTLCALMKETP